MIEVRFKKTHDNAVLPHQNNVVDDGTSDSGYDLYAVEDTLIPRSDSAPSVQGFPSEVRIGHAVVPVGIEVAYIQPGYWFKIEGRSGLGFKHGIQPHFGIIDNQYRGDLGVKLYNLSDMDYVVKSGDKIAQMVFYPLVEAEMSFTDEKHETSRGEKGFGSSD